MNIINNQRKKALTELLLDQHALYDDRDDAAMDLGEEFEEDDVLNALIQVGKDHNELDTILSSCGESIGAIWVKRNSFDKKCYDSLSKEAQYGIYYVLRDDRPEWLDPLENKWK